MLHQQTLDHDVLRGGAARGDLLVLSIAGALRLAAGVVLGFRPFDDTYITFRYALNLASGLGFVYNPGEPVLGTTTPLWTLALAGLAATGVPLETGALLLSLVLDGCAALLLHDLLRRLAFPRAVTLAAPLLFLATFDYLSLSRSGMESSAFVFLTLATLHAIAARRLPAAGLLFALAWLTRPEGAALGLVLAIALWRERRSLAPVTWLRSATLPALLLGGWTVFALVTFGSAVPQSVVAKAAASGGPDLARFSRANVALFFLKGQFGGEIFARSYLQLSWAMTLLAGIAALRLGLDAARSREGAFDRALLLLVFPSCYVSALALAHAFTFYPWYYAPIYPFLAALAAVGAWSLAPSRPLVLTACCALLVAAQVATAVAVKLPADRSFWIEGYLQASAAIPRDADVTVAALEIGTVGWRVWPARILDLEGLVTPSAVGVRPDDVVKRASPDFIVLRTDNAAAFLASAGHAPWFTGGYELLHAVRDPFVAREFRTYRRVARHPLAARSAER